MCLGVPAQITRIKAPGRATVEISGVSREISTDLLAGEDITPGQWVLVHVGFALSVIDEEEAALTLQQIQQLGGGTFEDELDSFRGTRI
ncbi:HypC/HybG/HupF family hydrogenase formation chaperone [Corynebacterium sp. 3HC-13]|uniref:HypC/HybG/HupF family hydrogenase formation chaperone n=1 Tax=Corynebacterium poyangense TaxID=2684405 RepID=UPI001CCA6EBF|nr:HypC/HybG/HupF family hydrogenase formation chaperone [Corynebacterium poyangense]MBZ8176465.1 HypC/HybG/HupF family hydrogenase formation chaperone [Corynebacterium poyangense]